MVVLVDGPHRHLAGVQKLQQQPEVTHLHVGKVHRGDTIQDGRFLQDHSETWDTF